ncbi:MAG: hypothetical protein JEZ07_08435 [Phycisphaerae bacterium]|nr:hypothetical protein [Phycisphaerae bacterium]
MKRREFLASLTACAAAGCIVGCKSEKETASDPTEPVVKCKCPVCDAEMPQDTYCVKCNAIATVPDKVHCDKCGMDKDAGTYCAKCNRFLLNTEIKCDKSGKTIVKGTYCDEKKQYRRLPTVGYCEKCKKPFDTKTGCTDCGFGKPE